MFARLKSWFFDPFGYREMAERMLALEIRVELLSRQLEELMHSIEDVIAKIETNTTAVGGLKELILGLKQQIADLTNGQVPPALQAKIDSAFDKADAQAQAIVDAMNANVTPPSP